MLNKTYKLTVTSTGVVNTLHLSIGDSPGINKTINSHRHVEYKLYLSAISSPVFRRISASDIFIFLPSFRATRTHSIEST